MKNSIYEVYSNIPQKSLNIKLRRIFIEALTSEDPEKKVKNHLDDVLLNRD